MVNARPALEWTSGQRQCECEEREEGGNEDSEWEIADDCKMSETRRIHCPAYFYRNASSPMFFVSPTPPLSHPIFLRSRWNHCGAHAGKCRTDWSRCKALFNHPQPKPSSSRPSPNTSAGAGESSRTGGGRRGIGSDKNPLDLAYYDVLGVDSQCEVGEIKKAYRRLAIKVRPPPSFSVLSWELS